jgi:membrane protein YdbS with pleckstrin-like domain
LIPAASHYCNQCGAKLAAETPSAAGEPSAQAPFGAPPAGAADAAEKELWQGGYSALSAAHLSTLCLVFALTDGFVAFKLFEAGTTRWLVLGAAALPAIYVGGGVLAAKLGVHYRLTTQRLFIREGILTRTLSEVELVRVDDVTVRQGLIQRLFGVGDVLLASTDRSSGAIEILGIDRPIEVKEMIRATVRRLRGPVVRMESV